LTTTISRHNNDNQSEQDKEMLEESPRRLRLAVQIQQLASLVLAREHCTRPFLQYIPYWIGQD
jgi:hypothetical protein